MVFPVFEAFIINPVVYTVWLCEMLLLNDISNLLTLMVAWDNSFQYQNICVIAHNNKREDFRQLALFPFVWTTCFGRSRTDTDLTEQGFSSVERDIYEIFIIGIQRIHPSFSTAVWNLWSRKWTFSMGKSKTTFQRVVFQISRPFIFWLSCFISEASI